METMTQAPWLSDYDLYLFAEGTHRRIYEKLGAHCAAGGGVHFAVWEPEAEQVWVIGEFSGWRPGASALWPRGTGIWEGFVPEARAGQLYKFRVDGADRSDSYAFAAESGALGASRIWDLEAYRWSDAAWTAQRAGRNCPECPVSIYRADLASWRRPPTCREIAQHLADYVHEAGYTHVEFLPVTAAGADYAPDAALGSPDDWMYLVDSLHRREVGVILELRTDNARFWLDRYHADGVRIGAGSPDLRTEFPDRLCGLEWRAVEEGLPEDAVLDHGQESLLPQMAGDEWRKFANLRLLFAKQFGLQGKKLIFMGNDFGQWSEWRPEGELGWHWLQHPLHAGLLRWVRDLNTLYRGEPSLRGEFERVDANAWLRRGRDAADVTLFVLNHTAEPRSNYRLGAPLGGYWAECLNSDAILYGGSGRGNLGGVEAVPLGSEGQPYSLNLTLPPLGALVLRPSRNQES